MRNTLPLIAAAVCIGACAPAFADAPRWYAGLAGGQSRTGDELVRNRESTVVNASFVESDFDSTDSAWKVFGGFRVNDMLAIEASYVDLGQSTLTTHTVTPGLAAGAVRLDRKISGFGVDAVLSAPVAPRFTVFGRVGAFRSRLEADASLTGAIEFTDGSGERSRSVTLDETVAHFGAGAEWRLRPDMALRLEWERCRNVGKAFAIGGTGTTGEADTDLVSLGVVMRF
ncbi:MAG TPA: outer membrane beta-barrel protein [Usitatibacter sp.]